MAERHDIELMQHADGELELELSRDEVARAKVEAVGEVGELVRGHLELAADDVPQARFDAIWREVDKVVQNTAPVAAAAGSPAPVGVLRRISRWFDTYRSHLIVGAVSAGAVAALAIVINPLGGDRGIAMTNGPNAIVVRPAAMRSLPAVESLETPGGTGNVLVMDDEDGHTAVIWVTPQDIEGI